MKKRQGRKNPHAVALGRLGGLVRSVAKQRANRENGRKGGLVKSRKETIAVRRNARRPRSGRQRTYLFPGFVHVSFSSLPLEGGVSNDL
jgi:hypothetical protein